MSNEEENENETPLPKTAEDAKRAKALASIEQNTLSDENTASSTSKDVDQERLGKAMADLSGGGGGAAKKTAAVGVKVNAEDVAVVMEEMEVTKVKATELLRANGADLNKTLRSMILPTATEL